MVEPDPLFRTQQVAEAFRVSASTIKRWVDSGAIRATRTLGKHRLIARSEAYRFARERNLRDADWGALTGAGITRPHRVDDRMLDDLTVALKRGRAAEARQLLLAAHALPGGTVLLGDALLRPAMERIGHGWEDRSLDVFQEHRASRIVEGVLLELIGRTAAPKREGPAPLAIGSTPEGDLYSLSGLLCELALREQGWDVMNLGPNLPLSSLTKAVRAHRPRLGWISINHLVDQAGFVREYTSFFSTAGDVGTAVILGGHALTAELRPRLLAASFADRIAHLAEFAKQIESFPNPNETGRSGDTASADAE